MKKIIPLLLLILTLTCTMTSCKGKDYKNAVRLVESGNYEEAHTLFTALEDYKDSQEYLGRFHYIPVSYTEKYSDDDETYTIKATLGDNNLPSKLIHTEVEDGESYEFSVDVSYNANGKIIKLIENEDGYKYITDYTYDAKGNMIKGVYTDSDGETESLEIQYKLVYLPFDMTEEQLNELLGFLFDT